MKNSGYTSSSHVVYIAGVGRSGSTLLERLIADRKGFSGLGEVIHLNDRGIRDNQLCGCGTPFADCEFWADVGKVAFGGWENVDGHSQHLLRRSVDRNRELVRLIFPIGSFRDRIDTYSSYIGSVYAACKTVSGAGALIDSSKHPSYAYLLRRVPNVDLSVVHIVRDPRGVAYSWAKKMRRPEVTNGDAMMPRYGVARIAMRWSIWNLLTASLRLFGVRVLQVRYEQLVADPAGQVDRIVEFVGVTSTIKDAERQYDSSQPQGRVHSVAGNPMRFDSRGLTISADEEWREALPLRKRLVVSVVTWPTAVMLRMIERRSRRDHSRGMASQ